MENFFELPEIGITFFAFLFVSLPIIAFYKAFFSFEKTLCCIVLGLVPFTVSVIYTFIFYGVVEITPWAYLISMGILFLIHLCVPFRINKICLGCIYRVDDFGYKTFCFVFPIGIVTLFAYFSLKVSFWGRIAFFGFLVFELAYFCLLVLRIRKGLLK